MDELLDAEGMKMSDFALASELKADEHGPALCDNKIDALLLRRGPSVGQHPGPDDDLRRPAGAARRARVDALVKKHPYYAKVTIPGGIYANNPKPTPTYGVLATVVTSTKVSADAVYIDHQGGVREPRRVQEAAPGVRAPRPERT